MMFYFDRQLENFEARNSLEEALCYLQLKFQESSSTEVLNSLVGFSWYYLIECPIENQNYATVVNDIAFDIWKSYIDIGIENSVKDPSFCFIVGYTLAMDGFFLGTQYEDKAISFLEKAMLSSDNPFLRDFIECFLANERSRKYQPLNNSTRICQELFSGKSLLEQYFRETYI